MINITNPTKCNPRAKELFDFEVTQDTLEPLWKPIKTSGRRIIKAREGSGGVFLAEFTNDGTESDLFNLKGVIKGAKIIDKGGEKYDLFIPMTSFKDYWSLGPLGMLSCAGVYIWVYVRKFFGRFV